MKSMKRPDFLLPTEPAQIVVEDYKKPSTARKSVSKGDSDNLVTFPFLFFLFLE